MSIKLKPQNVGKFTDYCKRKGYKKVTAACEEEGLASRYGNVRKMANFSRNARKWKKS